MRLIQIEVSGANEYIDKEGRPARRGMALKFEVESGDSDTSAAWDAQRQLDNLLESWLDLNRKSDEPLEAPVSPPTPKTDDELPF